MKSVTFVFEGDKNEQTDTKVLIKQLQIQNLIKEYLLSFMIPF